MVLFNICTQIKCFNIALTTDEDIHFYLYYYSVGCLIIYYRVFTKPLPFNTLTCTNSFHFLFTLRVGIPKLVLLSEPLSPNIFT